MVFYFIISIFCFRYIASRCYVEMPRNRSICFNIKLEEYERKEKTMDGAVYTPDSCCYAWTNYYTVVNYGGREIRFKNNYTYCEPYEKSKIEETIKTVKDKYINYEDPKDANGLKLYEGMLIKVEGDLRNHIRVTLIFIINLYFKFSTSKN